MNRRFLVLIALITLVASFASARWIDDKVEIETKEVGKVVFSHYDHLEAVGRNCPTCHNTIFDIDQKKNKTYSMAEMEKGKSCGACHNGKRAFSVSGDCASCHAGDVMINNVKFSHSLHVDMYGCEDCHSGIFLPSSKNKPASMAQMDKGASCGACHNGDDAFATSGDCGTCHTTRDVLYSTKGAGNILFSHEVHVDMFGCKECHYGIIKSGPKKPTTMAQMEKGATCGVCHNGGVAFSVADDCSSCHPTKEITFKTETAGDTLFSHDVHTGMYSCSDCHSDIFAPKTDNTPVSMGQMEEGKSCGACHNGDDAFSVAEDCSSCHPTREITFKTETAGTVLFSHDVHTSMVSCSDCHLDVFGHSTGNAPVSMSQMEEGKSCGACHNGDDAFSVAENCSTCHPTRDITFKTTGAGNISFSHDIHTDMYGCPDCHTDVFQLKSGNTPVSMAQMESGISCGSCHNGDDAFSVAEDCASCHPTRDITFKEEDTGDVLFSHEVHTGMYGCSDCHPGRFVPKTDNAPVSMEQMETGQSCGGCHNGDDAFSVAEDCESCHIEN